MWCMFNLSKFKIKEIRKYRFTVSITIAKSRILIVKTSLGKIERLQQIIS